MTVQHAAEIRVFLCYAPQDEQLLQHFKAHVAELYRQQIIHMWYDHNAVLAGGEPGQLLSYLDQSDLILLFISPDFLNSNDCYTLMERAGERYRQGKTEVLAIYLRPSDCTSLTQFVILPDPQKGKAVTQWESLDDILKQVVEAVRFVATRLLVPKLIGQGDALVSKQRYQESLSVYERAEKLHKDISASAAANTARERTTTSVTIYRNMGKVLLALKRPHEALTAYEQAHKLAPDDADLWQGIGKSLEQIKEYPSALGAYERALQLRPIDAQASFGKAQVLRQLKRYEEALTAYNDAIRDETTKAEFYRKIGELLSFLKRDTDALPDYDQALQLAPDDVQSYLDKGLTLCRLERYEEALTLYEQVHRRLPNDVNLYLVRSDILFTLRRYEEALLLIDRAIDLEPSGKLHNKRSSILNALGRYEEAEAAAKEAFRLNFVDSSVYANLGLALLQLNFSAQALHVLDRGLQLFPTDPNLQRLREQARQRQQPGDRGASTGSKQTAQVRDVPAGTTLLTYRGHSSSVESVAWSPDGKYLASGSGDAIVQVWEAVTGRLLLTYRGHTYSVWSVGWSPDGKYLASGSSGKTVQVWRAPSS